MQGIYIKGTRTRHRAIGDLWTCLCWCCMLVPISSVCVLGRFEMFGNETCIDGNSKINLAFYFCKTFVALCDVVAITIYWVMSFKNYVIPWDWLSYRLCIYCLDTFKLAWSLCRILFKYHCYLQNWGFDCWIYKVLLGFMLCWRNQKRRQIK